MTQPPPWKKTTVGQRAFGLGAVDPRRQLDRRHPGSRCSRSSRRRRSSRAGASRRSAGGTRRAPARASLQRGCGRPSTRAARACPGSRGRPARVAILHEREGRRCGCPHGRCPGQLARQAPEQVDHLGACAGPRSSASSASSSSRRAATTRSVEARPAGVSSSRAVARPRPGRARAARRPRRRCAPAAMPCAAAIAPRPGEPVLVDARRAPTSRPGSVDARALGDAARGTR